MSGDFQIKNQLECVYHNCEAAMKRQLIAGASRSARTSYEGMIVGRLSQGLNEIRQAGHDLVNFIR